MFDEIILFWAIGVGENGDRHVDEVGKGDGVALGDCIRPGDWGQAWGDDDEDEDECWGFVFEYPLPLEWEGDLNCACMEETFCVAILWLVEEWATFW